MKIPKKVIIIIAAVLVLLIGGGVAFATNTPTARAERQLNLGNKYLQEGKYQEAILAFQKVIEIEPKNIPARLGLGRVYVAIKEYPKAETVLKEVIEIDQNNIDARKDLFQVYVKEGNTDLANTILQELVKLDPSTDIKQYNADLNTSKAISASKASYDQGIKQMNDKQYLAAVDSFLKVVKEDTERYAEAQTKITDCKKASESVAIQRMHGIVLSPEKVKDTKSKGYPKGSVSSTKRCYFDSSKNIAYIGMMNADGEPEEANVIRIHNPIIIPFNEVPLDGPGNKILRELGEKFNISKAIKVEGLFSGGASCYEGIYVEGNDFEGDLKKAGISTDYLVYFDK